MPQVVLQHGVVLVVPPIVAKGQSCRAYSDDKHAKPETADCCDLETHARGKNIIAKHGCEVDPTQQEQKCLGRVSMVRKTFRLHDEGKNPKGHPAVQGGALPGLPSLLP